MLSKVEIVECKKESEFFLCIFLARSFVRRKLLGPLGHFQIINRCTTGTQFSLPLFAFSIPISSNHKWTGEIHVFGYEVTGKNNNLKPK